MSRLPPWPPLPEVVRTLMEELQGEQFALDGPRESPPRPWDLCSLAGAIEDAVWLWLDEVAQWLNRTYGWTDEQVIPACWHQHEAIAHDLAALAFSRIDVYSASSAAFVGRWHADMEDFHRRMTLSLGLNSPCRHSHHGESPPRYTAEMANRAMSDRTSQTGE
ncbi:hypothetical protein [Streptomyces litchfieldiae]|uniref:Uncharacterized protein n=1 Tax=Streptomyces litchfieldiae TaxID=3075543 RepID=A0ABU2MMT4_9ACTN|nr:hypothetical protein [Streptomyces sp. DSM 44938]MDT0342717.1 hypothetical protein [Streptomyces sp. DSM 44938]